MNINWYILGSYLKWDHVEEDSQEPIQGYRWQFNVELFDVIMQRRQYLFEQFLEYFLVNFSTGQFIVEIVRREILLRDCN